MRLLNLTLLPFNSTMVRLKDKENRLIKHKLQKFQFHYGTIKRAGRSIQVKSESYFNSTMVRLKEIYDIYTPAPFDEFQFHYGTIKRLFDKSRQ